MKNLLKSLLITIIELSACFVFTLGFVMACGHISPNDIYNIVYPQPKHELTTIEAISRGIEFFTADYDDCNHEIVCTLAIGFYPSESYMTPIMVSLGYTRAQSEFILQFIVDTFSLYLG